MLIKPKILTRRGFLDHSGNLFAGAVLSLAGMPVATAEANERSSDLKKIILAQYAAYQELNVEKIVSFYTEDCLFDDHTLQIHIKNRNEMRKFLEQARSQFLAIQFELLNFIRSGDQAVSLHTQTGTIKLQQTPEAEPKKYSVYGVSLMEFAGGKIKRQNDFYDVLGLRKQLGLNTPGQ